MHSGGLELALVLLLAAVIADRRRRDLQRLQRAEDLRRRVVAADPLSAHDATLPAG